MYVQRELQKAFQLAIKQFPAVLITGPRQSGKSTFLQHELPPAPYITFDDSLNRDFALRDPNGFLDQFQDRVPPPPSSPAAQGGAPGSAFLHPPWVPSSA